MIEEIVKNRIYKLEISIKDNKYVNNVNVYYLKQESILVDIGYNKASIEQIEKLLQQLGTNINNINSIMLTHLHLDHIGAIKKIKNKDVYFIKNSLINEYLPEEKLLPYDCYRETEEILLRNCEILSIVNQQGIDVNDFKNENIDVKILAGHTIGDMCLLIKDLNMCICGDIIIAKSFVDTDYNLKINLKEEYFKSLIELYNNKCILYMNGHENTLTHMQLEMLIHRKIKKNRKMYLKFVKNIIETNDLYMTMKLTYPLMNKVSQHYQTMEVLSTYYALKQLGIVSYIEGEYLVTPNYKRKIEEYFEGKIGELL